MKEYKVPVQSLIDHIKTATDVDPWAKEMAEDMLKEQEPVLSHEDADGVPRCGSCGWVESWGCNYCDNCGKPLRWE